MVNKDAEGRTGVSAAAPEDRERNPREYGCGASKPTVVPESQCEVRFWVLRSPSRPDFFRPGGGTHQAVRKVREYVAAGRRWVVDMGLEKFFDRIRRYLQGDVASQGRALSSLLSNILLDDLDKELERRGHAFCRYTDDANIYVHTRRSGKRVMASIIRFLEKQLRLRVNGEKSVVARPWKRKFLGYSMTYHKLRGWMNYFKLAELRGFFEELDGWIRRGLRNIIWRQWKRPYTRAKNLMRRGLSEERAWKLATNGHGPWWNSGASHMNQAFPKKYFDTLGLVSLQASMLTMNRRGMEPYARWCKRGGTASPLYLITS